MSYQEYVLEVFKDHHDCVGVASEEVEELIKESSFSSIEKWLTNTGYNLNEYYN